MMNMPIEYEDNAQKTRSGYCAIIGRSNVGKSTLLNKLIGAWISSTAGKPQTTRQKICGILTEQDAQIVFIDTPGIHLKETHRLNTAMNKAAIASLDAADVILFVIEVNEWHTEEDRILELLAGANKPCLLCVNKIDKLRDRRDLLPVLAQLSRKFQFAALVPVSAVGGDNLTSLKLEVRKLLPHSQGYIFPEDQLSDRDVRFIVAEMIREQLTRSLEEELPYAVYVELALYEERAESVSISAIIWVARNSHKAIVIGRSGNMLKKIGSRTRASIERFLGKRCHLKLWVKVKSNWQDDPRIVSRLTA
jgi:GTP-binding protein Era